MSHLPADRAQLVRERFDAGWRARMRLLVTDELIEEHRRRPRGPHSDPLARLLRYLRSRPVRGKLIVVEVEPWREYRIGVLTGVPARSAEVLADATFATYEAAAHAVFLRRVAELMED